MTHPTMTRAAAAAWYAAWKGAADPDDDLSRPPMPEPPAPTVVDWGGSADWEAILAALVEDLSGLLGRTNEADFERGAAEAVHRAMPDDPALLDPEFWYWCAVHPGRGLVQARYPATKRARFPALANYADANGRDTLFYRLHRRGALGAQSSADYAYARPGKVDFWRSHVFRDMFAHHEPMRRAWLDFQFPDHAAGAVDDGKLPIRDDANGHRGTIRHLAKELSAACANVTVEALDHGQCKAMIERVYRTRVA
ncbi:MAG: hypothetical protein ACU0CO_17685 [Shimia sp.]